MRPLGDHISTICDGLVDFGERKLGVPLPEPTYSGEGNDYMGPLTSRPNMKQLEWGIDVIKVTASDAVKALASTLMRGVK